ncbi:related to regulatory protein involved in control of sterol uptake [Rhynchosporium agropyri]|uniref:Related to regulatory protein involved in control of sterol uptake n=1 Tax=Rhynchosporium agropyri TaxID=914238 RepID=A0A1E1LF72_9HELO|nr:related to regulatory protein involved in control of sterol uptake [Rhynchosporium agropyri]
MSSDFIPKRPHKKSRGGCGTCKSRKVKCNEAKPKCAYCEKRDLECVYIARSTKSSSIEMSQNSLSPTSSGSLGDDFLFDFDFNEDIEIINRDWEMALVTSSPPPEKLPSIGFLSSVDLRYMHQWSTSTWTTLAVGDWSNEVLRIEVPRLAFEFGFLQDCMLGLASLHQQQLLPDPQQAIRQTTIYRARALSSFRTALADLQWGTRKYEAALITSLLLVLLCSKDYIMDEGELIAVNWLVLYRGLSTVISLKSYEDIQSLSVSPIFRREVAPLKELPVIPKILMRMVREIEPTDPDFLILEHYCSALDALGMLYGQLRESGPGPDLSIRVVTWPSFINHAIASGAQQRRPRVLVILAYYMVFMRLVRDLWWVDGIAQQEFGTLIRLLDKRWLPYVEIPIRAMLMSTDKEVTEFLLR